MLSSNVKKSILEHKLSGYIKDDSNPSQARKRIKSQCDDAIKDLSLIARNSTQEEIDFMFDSTLIRTLLESIFYGSRPVNTKLANLFAHFGISACINEYENDKNYSPTSIKLITDNLKTARNLCYERDK